MNGREKNGDKGGERNQSEERRRGSENARSVKRVGINVVFVPLSLIVGIFIGLLISKCPEYEKKNFVEKEKEYPAAVTPKVYVEGKKVGQVEVVRGREHEIRTFPLSQTDFSGQTTYAFQREVTCYDYDFSPEFILAPEKFWNKRKIDLIFSPGITFYCQAEDYRFPCPVISAKLTIEFSNDGEKNFEVFFEDAKKTCSRKILEYSFVIDTFPPTTTIVPVGFSDFVTFYDLTFRFLVSEPVAYTLCKLDDGYWIDCSGGEIFLTNVNDGWHILWAYSVDLAGNEETERKKYIFRVDAKPPITLLLSAPHKVTNVSFADFVFESSEADVKFECNLDNAGWLPCSSPLRITELKPGLHIIKIRGIDSMGRYEEEPVTYSWSVVEGNLPGPPQPYIPPKTIKELIELRMKQKELEEELKKMRYKK